MSDPVPLRNLQNGPEGRAGRALEELRRRHSWSTDRRVKVWWGIRGRTAPARRRARLRLSYVVVGGGLAVALSLLVAGLTRPFPASSRGGTGEAAAQFSPAETWNRLELAELGAVEVSAKASFEVRDENGGRALHVRSGTLRAQILHQDPEHPVVVVTPQLRVVVVGTRFDVHAAEERSTVEVLEGRVRVERGEVAVYLGAGEGIGSDDARLRERPRVEALAQAEAPAATAAVERPAREAVPTVADCLRRPDDASQAACLRRLARGRNLAAQNALFTLGLLARSAEPETALEHFRAYRQRFPSGGLVAEAALRELDLAEALGRRGEAVEAAATFERLFPRDPRATAVAARRGELLCSIPGRGGEARSVVDALAARPGAEARAAAERVRARCDAVATSPGAPRGP